VLELVLGGALVRIVYMGSPEVAVCPLEQLLLNGHQIVAVYTRPDKPAGRGREMLATPVKKTALDWKLPVVQSASLKHPGAIEQLKAFNPEVVVVAAFGQILPQAILDVPCYGCLNIHPSLLPEYRGASPVISTILAGDDFAGVSVMRLDAGTDTGPVFAHAQVPVLFNDTAESLTPRLFRVGAQVLLEVLAELPAGKIQPVSQNDALASYTSEITREAGKIDWQQTAEEIWRMVRAYQPWPEAYTFWKGQQFIIKEAVPLPAVEGLSPGEVVILSQNRNGPAFGVGTGKGLLGVIKLQTAGKKAMSAADFLRGQRDFTGGVLG
jgi:methionyl-tRNA formyltransferase